MCNEEKRSATEQVNEVSEQASKASVEKQSATEQVNKASEQASEASVKKQSATERVNKVSEQASEASVEKQSASERVNRMLFLFFFVQDLMPEEWQKNDQRTAAPKPRWRWR